MIIGYLFQFGFAIFPAMFFPIQEVFVCQKEVFGIENCQYAVYPFLILVASIEPNMAFEM